MNALWGFFWPLIAAGLVIGAIAGSIGFRLPKIRKDRLTDGKLILQEWRRKQTIVLSAGVAACIAAAGLWSGPLGAADRLTSKVESDARLTLRNYEMTQVTAHLHRAPLSRTLLLSGRADDFQRSELVRIMNLLSGVRDVSWSANRTGVPLIAESVGAAILGFLLGLVLAYLVELRRRYNAQWNW
jgi:hypothetical protein